ncbi:hypothetical protein PIROE2DRAFT_11095, partial [Piromyces sp. E2]
FKCTEYKTANKCKFYITLNDNNKYKKKQLPPDISTFNEIPDESEYYINDKNENFMIFKNSNIILLFQTELFIKYNENIFVDGIFYISPIFGYQVFITRVYAPEINSFYTTSLSILNNKEQIIY